MLSEDALVLGGSAQESLGNHAGRVSSATPQQFWDDFGARTEQRLSTEFPKGFAAFVPTSRARVPEFPPSHMYGSRSGHG